MSRKYDREEIYAAMREADKAGDAEAVRILAEQLNNPEAFPDDGVLRGRVTDESPMEAVGTNVANIATGYVQGAAEAAIDFPLTIGAVPQVAVNSLLGGARALFNDVTGDPAEAARVRAQTEQMNERAWNTATPVANVFNALAPAPEGYETQRDVARFAGGFLVPGPKAARAPIRAPSPAAPARPVPGLIDNAAEVVAEGEARGVPVMRTDIMPPKSGMGRMIKQTIPEKIPFAGMSGPRQTQQEARIQAVKDVVDEFGGNSARELMDSNTVVQEIARTLGTSRANRITKLKSAKDAVIQGISAPFNAAPNAVRAIDEQIARLNRIDDDVYSDVVQRLSRFKDQLTSGKMLEDVEGQRRLLGEMFNDPGLAAVKSDGQKAVNAIYDPLRRDMGDFIEAQAGKGARTKWARANEELAAMAGELESSRFKSVLRDTDTTPEAVGRILFSGRDNVSDMARLVKNLPPAGQKKVQAALIQRAFDNAGGSEGVSVERFLNNVKGNAEKFGIAFQGADRQSLEGLRRLLEATRRGAESGANVRTGEQNLPTVLGIGATQVAGLGGGAATLGVGGLLARVYESPMMRDRLLRLASTRPGSPQESRALEVLMRSAAPIVTQWREALPKALNDNPANLVAASEGQEPQ